MEKNMFEKNALSFDAEIKLMRLLGADERVISELIDMRDHH